ncbi:MAG TPA: ferritin-like domain-containing protein [Solirubrobacteraceae bacterium]|nr:ferritin-like domain-containing protein [Solirubrobacteraceae bacterium]
MFEKLDTPRELFTYKLGAALEMEQTVLKMLGNLQEEAQDGQLTELFRHHAGETRQQIRNLELAFEAVGEKPDDKPCPAIEGIDKEGKANVKKASDQLVDAVILSGAAETEHHEIAVYEGLITQAEALGEPSVVTLLRQNLEQEEHTLDEVRRAARAVAQRTRHVAA